MSEQQPKDLMIKFKGAEMKKNSKGGDYIVLKLLPDELEVFIEDMRSKVTERGIRLDVHVSDKSSEDGRQFKSAIAFVKGIQEFGAPKTQGSYAATPKPGAVVSSTTKSAIDALKRSK